MAMNTTVTIPTKAYIDEAKTICVSFIPFFTMGPEKNAKEETLPAGKNILIKFRFKKKYNVFSKGNFSLNCCE